MKISRLFCQRLVTAELPPAAELAALITGRGLEVEEVTPVACSSGIVAGEITACAPHPAADKLRLCSVNIGGAAPLQLVCGAPNVRKGMRVAVAPAEQSIVSGVAITARQFRGEVSAGMICSAAELGVGEDKSGIMELAPSDAEIGEPLDEVLLLNDNILQVEITPNRGDCLSHLGVAREIAALLDAELVLPPPPAVVSDNDETVAVRIDPAAAAVCPYYGCVVLRTADCRHPLPWQWRTLIERCGSRPVSTVVDITNYLMLVYGQPLHAFDLDKLAGGICVRYAAAGETLTVLDGSTVTCRDNTLLIADDARPVALAGVMGGSDSGITAETKNILLEGAHFSADAVAGRTRDFKLNSEAAFRFERGVDFALPPQILARAAACIKQVCGGTVGKVATEAGAVPPPPSSITLPARRIGKVLGVDIPAPEAARLLNTIALATDLQSPDNEMVLQVQPPSWRFDLTIAEDVIEEICRLYGYARLPETLPVGARPMLRQAGETGIAAHARAFFAAHGMQEIISYAFVSPAWERALSTEAALPLANPMSEDMSLMRTTLWGGLIDRALFNLHRRQEQINLFEIGRCFLPNMQELPHQPLCLAGLLYGLRQPAQWAVASRRPVDFYDTKGLVEMFLAPQRAVFEPETAHPALHPGKAARIMLDGQSLGLLGELHPQTDYPAAQDFRTMPLLFALDLDLLAAIAPPTDKCQINAVSPFPTLWRDLACVTDSALPVGELLAAARAVAPCPPVLDVQLFDFYAGDGVRVAKDKNSCGLRFLLQGQQATLTSEEIDTIVKDIFITLKNRYHIELRD